jgi:hypothetical protein
MNVQAMRSWREAPGAMTAASLVLASGGDERILIDAATQRNRYATGFTPCPDEVFFSSSTASTITPRSYRAVETAWRALGLGDQRVDLWFERLRKRLLALFGIEGAAVVLAGSGTDSELIALAIAKGLLGGPLTNIVLAPGETGSGVLRAAGGAHFLGGGPFGEARRAGAPLRGWEDADIGVASVEIRDHDGHLRRASEIDAEVGARANAAIAAGRGVLAHLLQSSKTGRSGLSVAAASQILADAPDRTIIIADCCQLRCSREHIRHLLRCGFIVAITGSKFFGGPPFSGALLLPPSIVARIGRLAPPAGLADFTSRLDWPDALRGAIGLDWRNDANLGLGLRWVAALEEMERYYRLPIEARLDAFEFFARHVRERRLVVEHMDELSSQRDDQDPRRDGILSFVMTHPDGEPFSFSATAAVHARLRTARSGPAGSDGDRIFHVGQPVAVGPRTALRVCASAPMISAFIERGDREDGGMGPVEWVSDIDRLFAKWRRLMRDVSAQRDADRAP